MPTTSRGIIYPDSSGGTSLWQHFQNVAESMDDALSGSGTAWTSWTPTWNTTQGCGPTTLGTGGVSEGFYQIINDVVHAEFRVQLGTGFAFSGTTSNPIAIILPVAAYVYSLTSAGVQSALGSWTIRDDSVPNHYAGTLAAFNTTFLDASFSGCWDGTAPRQRATAGGTIPITFAANDIISGVLDYRKAA